MKKAILFLTLFGLLISCSKDKAKTKNPYLPNYTFSLTVNMNLPLYSGLTSPMNPIPISDSATGVNIIAMKISDTDFRAWNAYCPNQYPSSCSLMTVNGINAKCDCDNIEYSLFTGIGSGEYSMVPFSVQILGNNSIRIYNN